MEVEQGPVNDSPPPVFVNQTVLEHKPHSFIYILPIWLLLLYSKSQVVATDHIAHKVQNIYYVYYLALYRKSLLSPEVEDRTKNII